MKTFLYVSIVLFCTALCPAAIHPAMADFNNDGRVDLADLAEFASAWLWESSCDTAVTVELNTVYTGSTDSSYWYAFTPNPEFANPGDIVSYYFNMYEIPDGYTLYVWSGCEGELVDQTTSFMLVNLTVGDTYSLEMRKTGTPTGEYQLKITLGEG